MHRVRHVGDTYTEFNKLMTCLTFRGVNVIEIDGVYTQWVKYHFQVSNKSDDFLALVIICSECNCSYNAS